MAGRQALLPGELGAVQVSPAPKGGFTGRAYTRDGGGEKRRLYAAGGTEVEVRSSLELQAQRSVYVGGEMTPETPLTHALQKWLEDREGEVRLQSMRIYRDTVRWLTPMAGALLIGDMTPQQCKSLLTDIKNRRSAGAVDHARTPLNGALGVAVEDGVIDHNPLLSLRKRKGQKRIPTALTVEQVRVLRDVVRAREERVRPRPGASALVLRWTIELQLGSSCRVSEALALRNVDHDRENGCIAVTGTMVDDED